MTNKTWTSREVNLTKGVLKARQAENDRRANAWQAEREAELEAVLGRSYDGMDVPAIAELMAKVKELTVPFIAEFDRLFAAHYPAEFARARLCVGIIPGGIADPDLREAARKAATRHLQARRQHMQAKSSGFATTTVAEISLRATDNPDVKAMIASLALPDATTPQLDTPGPAIGMLARLLPHPEEWGLAGYEASSPLLPAPDKPKALPAPRKKP